MPSASMKTAKLDSARRLSQGLKILCAWLWIALKHSGLLMNRGLDALAYPVSPMQFSSELLGTHYRLPPLPTTAKNPVIGYLD
jgi:hypothetical protein